jgi:hypothetical protein
MIALLQELSLPPYENTPVGPGWMGIVVPLFSLIASMAVVFYVYKRYAR